MDVHWIWSGRYAMELRVLAVSAPELPEGGIGRVLTSSDPASLFNATRLCALHAQRGLGGWRDSNWAASRQERRQSLLLMHSLREELPEFVRCLERVRPNLLLIGAMTPCLPGAIACARAARDVLGEEVIIVLGGRHASETVYVSGGGVAHHAGSPLRLMEEGRIPPVFDLVVAGEAEVLLASIGDVIGRGAALPSPHALLRKVADLHPQPAGAWIIGTLDDGKIATHRGPGTPIDRDGLPAPCEMFGISSAFDVFDGRLTAHVFSDTGSGCAYDCEFCSERRSVTGPLQQLDTAPARLAKQLRAAAEVVRVDSPSRKASAFCEDSTMLGGSPGALRQLARMLREDPVDVRFGGQLTIDQILSRGPILSELHEVGLDYLFIGLETLDPSDIGGMSKDVGHRKDSWLNRTEQAFEILGQAGIRCGAAVLFGLGESHASRLRLLGNVIRLQQTFGMPHPVSANWAVQHPLQGADGGTGFTYDEWGIPPGPFLDAFADFGEATVRYPLAGQPAPVLEEVLEVASILETLPGKRHEPEET
jgi:B12-binding domain/radical SAM domain protein